MPRGEANETPRRERPALARPELAIRLRGAGKARGDHAADGLDLDVPVGGLRWAARPERRGQVDDDAVADCAD
jgi:hypothetical protein